MTMFKSRLKTPLFAESYVNWTIVAAAHVTLLGALVVSFSTERYKLSYFYYILESMQGKRGETAKEEWK